MKSEVTAIEVKKVIFSMDGDRAPGPEGFNAHFFKKAWDVCIQMWLLQSDLSFFQEGFWVRFMQLFYL